MRAVKKAIDAGLPADAALRALTLTPAEIYGVADRLGSIDKGKIANLVIADGDLFADGTKVKYVFVDGGKFEPLPEAACRQAAGRSWRQRTRRILTDEKALYLFALLWPCAVCAPTTPVLIQNATILTVTNGTVKGSILLQNGKIAAIGEKVTGAAGRRRSSMAPASTSCPASSTATRTSWPKPSMKAAFPCRPWSASKMC